MDENTTLMDKVETVQEAPALQLEAAINDKSERIAANLSALRKKLEAEEAARKTAEQRLQEMEQRQSGPQQSYQQPAQDDEDDLAIDNDDYVQAKHVKTTNKKFKSYQTKNELELAELKKRLEYLDAKSEMSSIKDFDEIVSDDNLRTLSRLYPEDYELMRSHPNLKVKAKTAYNMIKNYGIIDTKPVLKQAENMHALEKKIEANKSKIGSGSAAGVPSNSPLSNTSRYNSEGRLVLSDADATRINRETYRKIHGS